MKIALLTFLDVANYGANLQAASTYNYLVNHGHDVWAIDYRSYNTIFDKKLSTWKRKLMHQNPRVQDVAHHEFVSKEIHNKILGLHTTKQVAEAIIDGNFGGVIIGSDAVAQHWPWFSTLKLGHKRPFWIEPMQRERRFPNPFWGTGYADRVPTAMMSVSSQNSRYESFSPITLHQMSKLLHEMTYISTRDAWTRRMMLKAAPDLQIQVTPDPVFALNQNLGKKIPTEEQIRNKYSLPKEYVLVGLRGQVFTKAELSELDNYFNSKGQSCVAFDIEGQYAYEHPFKYQIPLPLSPLDWFALIKFASAYIGSNMHPIVSSLTNAVPCFSIDNWGIKGKGTEETKVSSKVYDVLCQYNLQSYWTSIEKNKCDISVKKIFDLIQNFPKEGVREITVRRIERYNNMMTTILNNFQR